MMELPRGGYSRRLTATFLAALFTLLAGSATALGVQTSSASQTEPSLLVRGLLAIEEEDEATAIDLLTRAIEAEPELSETDLTRAWLGLAEAHEWAGDDQAAFEAYAEVLKLDRVHEAACLGYAARSYDVDEGSKGIRILTRLLRHQPEHVDALAHRGFLYQARSQPQRAIRDFELVADDPAASWILSTYAQALLEVGDEQGAFTQATRAVEYDPEDAYAYWVRGYVKHFAGNVTGGAEEFERAVALDPLQAEFPYEDYEGGAHEEPEISQLEALRAMVIPLFTWAALMSLFGLAIGLGGSKYLVAKEHRSNAGIQPVYDGPHKELFTIYIQNVALTLVTLGVYRFWAKVRTRRFHLTHTIFADGRFDYHATGEEKFIGFVKGMLILVPFGVAYYYGSQWMAENPTRILTHLGISYGIFFGLYLIRPLALVGGQRFNLARTSWNNLRFRFTGRLRDAYKLYIGDAFLIVLTLGIYWSWHLCRVRRFKLAHTTLGEETLDFRGEGSALFGIQLKGVIFTMMTLGIYFPWYVAERHRFWTSHSHFRRKRFHSNLTGKAVLAVGGPGFLATVLTLGLALPWAITRWRTMIAATTYYSGSIDQETLMSIQDTAATSTLEGVGEAGEVLGEIGDLFGL